MLWAGILGFGEEEFEVDEEGGDKGSFVNSGWVDDGSILCLVEESPE
jgi:hypothetical protein